METMETMDRQLEGGFSYEGMPVLLGPPWRCPVCEAPATRLVSMAETLPLDEACGQIVTYADYVWYLYGLSAGCRAAGHTARVVKLGNAITPLPLPGDRVAGRQTPEELAAYQVEGVLRVQAALRHIATTLDLDALDPIAALVYRLLAGRLAPELAIAEIRGIVDGAVAGAMLPGRAGDGLFGQPVALLEPVEA